MPMPVALATWRTGFCCHVNLLYSLLRIIPGTSGKGEVVRRKGTNEYGGAGSHLSQAPKSLDLILLGSLA